MRSIPRLAVLVVASGALLFASAASAVERQNAAPLFSTGEEFSAAQLYQISGLDFDAETPGIELVDEELFDCAIVAEGSGMIRVRYLNRLRFRAAADGAVAFVTDDLIIRSQPFPDPFDSSNQDMLGNLLYAYLTREGDVTSRLQEAVSLAQSPEEVLCGEEVFPAFGPFGVAIANSTAPAVVEPSQRTLLLGDSLTGSYALKADPTLPFWDFVHPQEGIGTAKYWAMEVSVGATDKGSVLSSRSFAEQAPFFEATPGWELAFEQALVGDMVGSGNDLIRIVERKDTPTPGSRWQRVLHFDPRSGSMVGSFLQYLLVD